ncbi:MAG: CAP domain-containing protein [Actinomycetota bacterium]|nr:CAP domain-containing protein [Actinomycetota bacterium]
MNHRLERCPGQQLQAHEGLRDVARAHSKDLADNHAALIDAFPENDPRRGHIGSDGSMPSDRIRNATELNHQAENVFWSDGLPRDAVGPAWNFWLNSPGHRANLDNCMLSTHAIGVYYDAAKNRTYLTHNFAG